MGLRCLTSMERNLESYAVRIMNSAIMKIVNGVVIFIDNISIKKILFE